jgi:hypothetical protein
LEEIMGKAQPLRRCILVTSALVCLLLATGVAQADDDVRALDTERTTLGTLLSKPAVLPTGLREGFRAICQDVVTVEEYERLTGVHRRLGIGVFGGIGILTGGSAGHGTITGDKLQADFGDIWEAFGFGGGVDLAIMVMPLYTVHVGIGASYHAGATLTDSYGQNTWDDLVAMPMYLAVRINLPLGVGPDKWFDFENPDIAAEKFGMILVPFVKLAGVGYLMREVYVDGWIVEPGKASVGGKEQYFRRGIYGGAYAGGGLEIRVGSIGVWGQAGFRYVWHPKLTLRFDELLTNGDFYDITLEFGITYYFGSGRLIKVGT